MKFLLALALPIYALDQATKWWILGKSGGEIGWQEPVIPNFFDLCYLANTGAAFSMFRDNNTPFIVIGVVALVAILIATLRNVFPDRASKIGVGLSTVENDGAPLIGSLTMRTTSRIRSAVLPVPDAVAAVMLVVNGL